MRPETREALRGLSLGPGKRVRPGDPLDMPADMFNAILNAVRTFPAQRRLIEQQAAELQETADSLLAFAGTVSEALDRLEARIRAIEDPAPEPAPNEVSPTDPPSPATEEAPIGFRTSD